MDRRISGDVTRTRDEVLDYEYSVIQHLCKPVGRRSRLVDVGCGSLGLLGRRGDRLVELQADSLGVDIDRQSLSTNRNVGHRLCASCYSLPLKDNSVDIVVCRWLFEHLESPEQAMREFSRVLRKGGFLYVKTPNLLNYAMVISWLTPTAFHNVFRSGSGMRENIPTFYRANTSRTLRRLATNTGFAVRSLEHWPYSFMYYAFNKELFLITRTLSRLVRKITDRLELMMFCVLEKV
jgi:ubiquinone/menaquinone biosynthesis C-methylase UbiE